MRDAVTTAALHRRTARDLILAVVQRLCRSQKAIAIDAGVAPSELSEALSGRRRFALDWLLGQDDEFLTTFLEELACDRHLTIDMKRTIARAETLKAIAGAVDEILSEGDDALDPGRLLDRAKLRLQLFRSADRVTAAGT